MCFSNIDYSPRDYGRLSLSPNLSLDEYDVCSYISTDEPEINKTDNLFKVLHLNIRGLVSKQNALSRLLHALGVSNKVNVVTLNETWLRKENVDSVDIPGYSFVSKCRIGNKKSRWLHAELFFSCIVLFAVHSGVFVAVSQRYN